MDPLSAAAAAAGILATTLNLIRMIDSICTAIKRQPLLLQQIAVDLKTLQSVVNDLNKLSNTKSGNDAPALNAVLQGCETVMKQISFELDSLQNALHRGRLARAYAQMTFSSKMEIISGLRDQLEKYKSTLLIALNVRLVRNGQSTDDVTGKINELRQEVGVISRKASVRPAWLNPIQQYLAASSDFVAPRVERSSSSGISSPTISSTAATIIDPVTPSDMSIATTVSPDLRSNDQINTFGSFDEWLEAFASDDEASPSVRGTKSDEMNPAVEKKHSPSPKYQTLPPETLNRENASWKLKSSSKMIYFAVNGLNKTSFRQRKPASTNIEVRHDDFVYKAIQKLHDQGYTNVCGFRIGDVVINPWTSIESDHFARVVTDESCYSFSHGLEINSNEPIEVFYDNFVRAAEDSISPSPITRRLNTESSRIEITDGDASTGSTLEISLDRTLRVPEDGTVYNVPALFSTFPLFRIDEFAKTLPADMVRKNGLLIPMFQREAISLNFYAPPSSSFAVKALAGTVNTVTGTVKNAKNDSLPQDHILAPSQARLDGFLAGNGLVKQFIAMPLGAGYSVEKQLTGKEIFGGLQLIIAPKFRERGHFFEISQSKTPAQAGLKPGNYVRMQGEALNHKSKSFAASNENSSTGIFSNAKLFKSDSATRPTFIHEVFELLSRQPQHRAPSLTSKTIIQVVEAVMPISIYIQPRSAKRYEEAKFHGQEMLMDPLDLLWHEMNTTRLDNWINTEVSPFLSFGCFYDILCRDWSCTYVVLFKEYKEAGERKARMEELVKPSTYVPISDYLSPGDRLYCQGYRAYGGRKSKSSKPQPFKLWPTPDVSRSTLPPAMARMGEESYSSNTPTFSQDGDGAHSYSRKSPEATPNQESSPGSPRMDTSPFGDMYYSAEVGSTTGSYQLSPTQTYSPSSSYNIPLPPGSQSGYMSHRARLSESQLVSVERYQSSSQPLSSALSDPVKTWKMAIAAGGLIRQQVLPDDDPDSWNWHRACFINIQILNSVIFEKMTNQPAPISPITFQDYIKARLPFYHTMEQDTMEAGDTLHNVKSVADLDKKKSRVFQVRMRTDSVLVGCVVCEENLADSVLNPCKHIFCTTCIRENMKVGEGKLACATCRKDVREVVQFSAPTESNAAANDSSISSTPVSTSLSNRSLKSDMVPVSTSLPQELDSIEVTMCDEQACKAEISDSNPTSKSSSATENLPEPEVALSNRLSATMPYEHLTRSRRPSSTLNLHYAAEKGDLSLVQTLLDNGHNPDAILQRVDTSVTQKYLSERPAHIAARLGHANVVYKLHEQGADFDLNYGENGYKVIHAACAYGQNATLLVLLGLDVSIETLTDFRESTGKLTPFEVAASCGKLDTLQLLIKKGADPGLKLTGRKGKNLCSAMQLAARGGHESTVRTLSKIGFTADHGCAGGWTPLMEAARQGHINVMRYLVQQRANINATDSLENTPIRCATIGGHINAVSYLLSAGAKVRGPSLKSPRAIHDAASDGNVEILKLLLEVDEGIDVAFGSQCQFDETPLGLALMNGSLHCCDLLLSCGATYGASTSLDLEKSYPSLPTKMQPEFQSTKDLKLAEIETRRKTFRAFVRLVITHKAFANAIYRVLVELVCYRSGEMELIKELLDHYTEHNYLYSQSVSQTTAEKYPCEMDFVKLIGDALSGPNPQVIQLLVNAARVEYSDDKWPRNMENIWRSAIVEAFVRGDFNGPEILFKLLPWNTRSHEANPIRFVLKKRKGEMGGNYDKAVRHVHNFCFRFDSDDEDEDEEGENEVEEVGVNNLVTQPSSTLLRDKVAAATIGEGDRAGMKSTTSYTQDRLDTLDKVGSLNQL